ncbi:hypothetical protein E4L68_18205 [Burkholderia pseudomallei]|nr:hypothetical protein [Burkholderia pseudomallei]MPT70561.1 hypothetical protein [Burkholderia pseudomallei]MPT77757.1 hypothetical protein [Burkholderia pseudomallei]MPU04599.1 hypothetical protein [Burkholderia pseudomallei]QEW75892.1 hypothetical protein E4F35_18850 [Burkholderia pseudomallei]RAP87992.1 hypothetical protein DPR01_19135 [Burkholderia pseudomallei]
MPAVPARVYPRARRAANHPGATRGRASGIGRRASGVGRRASGVGRRASGVGRRASGVGRRASGVGRRASGVGRAPAGARPRDKISFHSTTRGPSGTRPLKRPPDSTTDTLLDAGAGYARAHGEKYGWSLEMGQHQA